jgi:epoxide hydrolase-like predicted phosphatase
MIEAIIFDFGGVLMRTSSMSSPTGRHVWEQRLGLAQGQLEQIVHHSHQWNQAQRGLLAPDDYWHSIARALNLPDSAIPSLRSDYFRDDHLDNDLMALIADLRREGYKIGLLSNDAITLEDKLRHELAIYDTFDAVIISAKIGVMKPDPGAYQAIVQALGVAFGACVFIDDNDANVEGARRCGMTAIHYSAGMDVRAALTPVLEANPQS